MKGKRNYLFWLLGGFLLLSAAFAVLYALQDFSPLEGCVGVVEISGPIIARDVPATLFSDEFVGAETIAEQIESAQKRQDVKSVLVLIDSPGGSVVASRQIYDALSKLNKSKVAYINELAASGGYYAAAGTDYIVANPDAITGSIGARATFADMSGLFEKIGFNETTVKSGAMKDMGTSSRPMTDEERAVIESIINESFQEFRLAVEKGREGRLNRAEFEKILDARIVSGRQAKKIGLVDSLGGKKDAIKKAAEMGGIESEEPSLCHLSQSSAKRGLLGSLSGEAQKLFAQGSQMPRLLYQ